jgi:Zn-dependent M28 family amino/carboxypeptidase
MALRQRLLRWPVVALVGWVGLLGWQARAADKAVEARMRKDINFLASDQCEGRGPGTKGIDLAAEYIAGEFKKAGLKPGGPEGSYFQPFTVGDASLEGPQYLRLHGPQGQEIDLKAGEHFQALGLAHTGSVTAPLVFAGYGATTTKELVYDDYQGLDVEGKVVVVLRDTPRAGNKFSSFDGMQRRRHASFNEKLKNAAKHGAAAVIVVNDRDTAQGKDDLVPFSYLATSGSVNLPAVQMRRSVLDALFRSNGSPRLATVEEDIDRELKPHSTVLAGWTASMEVHVGRGHLPIKNIVGVLEGAGKLADETVVIGAHYDHLGYGGAFGSLAPPSKQTAIHHGADDNGSGTTTVMELARRFGRLPKYEGRRLVFMTFSGEERGLLGSFYYTKHPLYPLEETAAMLNLDMVGRLRKDAATNKDKLLVEGTGSSARFNQMLEQLNEKYHFKLIKKSGGVSNNSDHYAFYNKKIPVIFFWTDYHEDYHRPSDTADKINVPGMARIADLAEEVVRYLATVPERPDFIKAKSSDAVAHKEIPRLGIRPSYSDEGEGVLLDGVGSDGPAQKAGLKEGDRIIEMAGKPVKDLPAYMSVLGGLKKGSVVEVGILRNGKKLTLKVTPEYR